MTVVDRFTDACLARAARRWPDDVSVELVREWHAELSALRADRSLTRLVRAARSVAFAASLALSPPVEPAGAAPRTWRDRAITAGRPLLAPAGVTLAAGALFNLVHLVSRSVPVPARTPVELGALAVAVAAMARLGLVGAGWSAPRRPVAATVLTGLALYGFLLAGNPDPVMPFMGIKGTVASADFGTGVATPGKGDGRSSGKGVQASGFGAQEVAQLKPGSQRTLDSGPPTTSVEILFKPNPAYTEEARGLKLEGEVLLEVLFSASGQLHVNRVVRGLGHGLDENAIAAANKMRFKPALRNGQPMDSTAIVHVVFQLAY